MERKNQEYRRNHLNNCFNHNLRLNLRDVIPPELLPLEDDFIASRNIRDRLSSLPHSLKQHQREIEEFLNNKHEEFKRFLQSG